MFALSLSDDYGGGLSTGHDASWQEAGKTDAELAKLHAFSDHWMACQVSVRAYLASRLYDRSLLEDCVQEVALVAWKKAPLEAGRRAFLGHCLACARLIGMAAARKQGKSPLQFLPPDVAESLAETVARQDLEEDPAERLAALRSCLTKLDETQRRLLAMRYAPEGTPRLKDEAKRLGKSLDALYKKLERLRMLLRDCVTGRLG